MHLNLPSGGWAELRDPSTLRAHHQKNLLKTLNFEQDNKVAAGLDMSDGLIALLVTEWAIPYKREVEVDDGAGGLRVEEVDFVLPSQDLGTIDDLTLPDYGALTAAIRPAQQAMFPKAPDPSDYDDPASPTAPANA